MRVYNRMLKLHFDLWLFLVATIYQLLDFIKQFGKLKSPQLNTHSDLWLV